MSARSIRFSLSAGSAGVFLLRRSPIVGLSSQSVSACFVGRGFSHDINRALGEGLQPLKESFFSVLCDLCELCGESLFFCVRRLRVGKNFESQNSCRSSNQKISKISKKSLR